MPGGPASHGCVRVPMSSADWIYASLPVGTPVYVVNGPHVPAPFADTAATDAAAAPADAAADDDVDIHDDHIDDDHHDHHHDDHASGSLSGGG